MGSASTAEAATTAAWVAVAAASHERHLQLPSYTKSWAAASATAMAEAEGTGLGTVTEAVACVVVDSQASPTSAAGARCTAFG